MMKVLLKMLWLMVVVMVISLEFLLLVMHLSTTDLTADGRQRLVDGLLMMLLLLLLLDMVQWLRLLITSIGVQVHWLTGTAAVCQCVSWIHLGLLSFLLVLYLLFCSASQLE